MLRAGDADLRRLADGQPVLSCLILGIEAVGREIVTVEGMNQNGKPHPLQDAFADLGAAQCGYCIPGILLTAKALLDDNPNPSRDEIRQALSGNLCRCTGYTKILQAVELAAKEILIQNPLVLPCEMGVSEFVRTDPL